MSRSWLAAQGRLPLAFVGSGLAWLAVATALLAIHPTALSLPHVHPRIVALTHAWLLGFFLPVACGAVYQLAPVALGTTLWSERFGWWHLALHTAGVPCMVLGFWNWSLAVVGLGGLFVNAGVVLFCINVWVTLRATQTRGLVATSLGIAAGWLLTTSLVGLLIAANRHWTFMTLSPLALLRSHAHLGLVGFFLSLLQGVSFQLIPMFTLGEVPGWRPASIGFGTTQAGLVSLIAGFLIHLPLLTLLGGLAVAAGCVVSLFAGRRMLATRKKRKLEQGISTFLVGAGFVASGAVFGLALLADLFGSESGAAWKAAMVYALISIIGGLLLCFQGMLCKIVPFLTWMRAYGPKVGRQPTPSASALSDRRLEAAAFPTLVGSLLCLVAGVAFANESVQKIGVWLLASANGLFLANMIRVLGHLIRPVVPRTAPAPHIPHA